MICKHPIDLARSLTVPPNTDEHLDTWAQTGEMSQAEACKVLTFNHLNAMGSLHYTYKQTKSFLKQNKITPSTTPHQLSTLKNQLFSVHPTTFHLYPGHTTTITLSYKHLLIGHQTLSLLLRVKHANTLQVLNISIWTIIK